MKLNIKRPLAFFDIEATGASVSADRIVEISIIKVSPDAHEEARTWKVNPEMPIPLEASLIHGIYDKHVQDAPVFKDIALDVFNFLENTDLAGYNSNKFDIPILVEEFLRVGLHFDETQRYHIDVQNIFHQMEQRTLKAAYQFYCGKALVNGHTAETDARATMEVLLAQMERYADTEWEDKQGNKSKPIQNDLESLHRFTNPSRFVDFAGRMVYDDQGVAVFNFGKHKGKSVAAVFEQEPSYYSWIMQGDFALHTKSKIEAIYKQLIQSKKEIQLKKKHPQSVQEVVREHHASPQPTQAVKKHHPPHRKPGAKVTKDMLKQLQDKFGRRGKK